MFFFADTSSTTKFIYWCNIWNNKRAVEIEKQRLQWVDSNCNKTILISKFIRLVKMKVIGELQWNVNLEVEIDLQRNYE